MKAREALAVLIFFFLAASGSPAGELRAPLGRTDVTVPVKSWLEIRDDRLARQQWDVSCGAAALSTVLMHDFGADFSELTVAVSMLANTDPETVRERGGFSLLDLKRFSDAVGFPAEGFGGLTLDDIESEGVPAILPVRIRELDHFIVFRERIGGKVLIGDPAFGNLLVPENQFLRMWQSGIALFVYPGTTGSVGFERLPLDRMQLGIPDLHYLYRVANGPARLPVMR